MTSPEAPITHHWLDSTHIMFGVVTAGWVQGRLEARSVAVHGPRAGRGPLRHRAAAHGQHGAARELESRRQLVAAGVLGRRRESRAARARRGRGTPVRERALRARAGRRPLVVRDARLGPQESERGRIDGRARLRSGLGAGGGLAALRARRMDRDPRARRGSPRHPRGREALGGRAARIRADRAPAAGPRGASTRSTTSIPRWRRPTAAATRTARWSSCSSSPAPEGDAHLHIRKVRVPLRYEGARRLQAR